jgi:(heptosyl)LPS beta-1,4-glucosyltransferase
MKRASLSVVVICKNEENNLRLCLESVAWADEIIIFDSGSNDGTLDVATEFTDMIFVDTDWQGFGKQRQKAQRHASGDWVLALDADERVSPELKEEIEAALKLDDRNRVYSLPRLTWAFGAYIRHSGWYPGYINRLFPREKVSYNDALVHEDVKVPKGMDVVRLNGNIEHFSFRNLRQWVHKTADYASAWAEEKQLKGKKSSLLKAMLHAFSGFVSIYIFKAGFLDGRQGLVLAILAAYSKFLKYTDLWLRTEEQVR